MPNPTSQTIRGSAFPIMLFAGESRNEQGAAAAVILLPNGRRFTVSQLLSFVSKEEAEYQGLLIGLRKAQQLGLQAVEIKGDSETIFNQVNGLMEVAAEKVRVLYRESIRLMRQFDRVSVEWISAEQNRSAHKAVHRCIEEALGREPLSSSPRQPLHSEQITRLVKLGNRVMDQDLQALGQVEDDFSHQSLDELRPLIPIAIQDAMALQWRGDEDELSQMYQWYLRGLPTELAIRKVHLDSPILSSPSSDKLPWEGQLLGAEKLREETWSELSFISMGMGAGELGIINHLTPLPVPSQNLPSETTLLETVVTPNQNNHSHVISVSDYQDPFSTAVEDLEVNFMPKERGKDKETLPSLDLVQQIVAMIMPLSEEDKNRLVRELVQSPDLINRILNAIAETLKPRENRL